MFDRHVWGAVPFHFWSVVMFVFGSMVGSFLNVVIHRLPRGESLVTPGSHCPHCNQAIPWYRNLPLFTWLLLRGRCYSCKAPINPRYFIVELIGGICFLGAWLRFGAASPLMALTMSLLLAGFIAATFIDFEHFIIPDEITLGGAVVGCVLSLAVPAMHNTTLSSKAVSSSLVGIAVGAGSVYAILRLGKLLFGRQRYEFPPETRVRFEETRIVLPDSEIPYEDVFYRKSDTVYAQAQSVSLVLKDLSGPLPEKQWQNVNLALNPSELRIEDETFNPEEVHTLEVVTDLLVVPREAMGLGDVKFMAAIGAFLGWQAVIFSLMASAVIGSIVGVSLIALKRQSWSGRLPYGPYIALAATLWVFGARTWLSGYLPGF